MAMTRRCFFDKKFMERKLEVIKTTYEHHKELAAEMAGPAVSRCLGKSFSPEQTKEALSLTAKQEELSLQFDSRQSQIVNSYIPGEEKKLYDHCLSGAGDRKGL